MGLITVSGLPGCRFEEVARIAAQRLGFELLTESRLRNMIEQEFGTGGGIPDRAYTDVVTSILARLATEHHLVFCVPGAESFLKGILRALRVSVVAPESVRVGNLMLDRQIERSVAKAVLRELELQQKQNLRRKKVRVTSPPQAFDLVLNAGKLASEQMAELIERTARTLGIREQGLLSRAAEAQLQFRVRLRLSKHGIAPPGKVSFPRKRFAHPSEQIFANLLDFYRIAWEYEPRSFPVKWDGDGRVVEAFTPDFYLPEFDLYLELTTMKQSHVTRKNRKVKLLRELYPQLNIQVFYQKDFENLIFKYGLAGPPNMV